MAADSKTWEMRLPAAAAIWAGLVALAAILGVWIGVGGPRFAAALVVAATLLAMQVFLAAPSILAAVRGWLGRHGGMLAPLVPLCAVLFYSLTVTGDWKWGLVAGAYAVLPSLLLASSVGKLPGTWEDYVAAFLVWLPVEFRWMYRIFPYPRPLMHTLTILMALATALTAFLLVRRLEGIGYAVIWKRGFGGNVGFHFAVFAAIAVPLGMKIGFLTFDPSLARLQSVPIAALGILFFTAWPEEFLFRGLLQNLFSRTFKNEWVGLAVASVIFGFSHILHKPFPNWKYVLLATIAGIFYGRAWMKSGSLVPSTLVHALVDTLWHILFQ